jgi:hypothetical protein
MLSSLVKMLPSAIENIAPAVVSASIVPPYSEIVFCATTEKGAVTAVAIDAVTIAAMTTRASR